MTARPRDCLTVEDADRVLRNPDMGWDLETFEQAKDVRAQMLSHQLRDLSADLSAEDEARARERRARVHGMILGLIIAILTYLAGAIVAEIINRHWPPVCDGTASAAGCAVRILEVD